MFSGTMLLFTLLMLFAVKADAINSTCYGETHLGYLHNGINLPSSGPNFVTYSRTARAFGRTFVHSEVRHIMLAAYKQLQHDRPEKKFKYAETGFKSGGKFSPHKTHQNGLSVDFMTPVIDEQDRSVHLPTHALNRLGYDIEFDSSGRFKQYRIDYDALAAHVVALHKAAVARGHEIWRVIFDPKLQPNLYNTEYADYLRQHIQFSTKASWVRHDEHYHVDFRIPCEDYASSEKLRH